MATDVMSLREYADLLAEVADDWDGEQPAVLIGDVNGSLSVTAKDGYTQHGSVAYAHECFDDNGVNELGQKVDRRFYGTLLIDPDNLDSESREQLDLEEFDEGGDA